MAGRTVSTIVVLVLDMWAAHRWRHIREALPYDRPNYVSGQRARHTLRYAP